MKLIATILFACLIASCSQENTSTNQPIDVAAFECMEDTNSDYSRSDTFLVIQVMEDIEHLEDDDWKHSHTGDSDKVNERLAELKAIAHRYNEIRTSEKECLKQLVRPFKASLSDNYYWAFNVVRTSYLMSRRHERSLFSQDVYMTEDIMLSEDTMVVFTADEFSNENFDFDELYKSMESDLMKYGFTEVNFLYHENLPPHTYEVPQDSVAWIKSLGIM